MAIIFTRKSTVLFSSWLLLLLLLLPLALLTRTTEAAAQCSGNRLVVLAGPRRSATSSVAEFLYKYARGTQPNHKQGKIYHPLAKFRWPLVYGEHSNKTETEMPYKRYNHLVTDPDNKPLRDEILEAIKRDWDQGGVNAVIFGGEEFDQVPFTQANMKSKSEKNYNAIEAVQAVVDYIQAPPECVTILLNYRVPRFEHWVSLYSSLMVDGGTMENDEFMPYEEHMCEDKSSTDRVQELGTSMNPMFLAESYLAASSGWNVQMIDMGGVADFGSDISHTIACEILGGVCDDEKQWVKGHVEETITNKVLQADFDSLPDEEVVQSEKLFQYRDCAFEEDLSKNERFSVVRNKTIWTDCIHDVDHEWVYQTFRHSDIGARLMFDALLSQVDCKPYGGAPSFGDRKHSEELEAAKIEDFLSGTYQKHHNIFETIEEEFEDGSFSTPLVLVVLMFAGGAGFYAMKIKEDPNYTPKVSIPSFEMGGFSDVGIGDGISGFRDMIESQNRKKDDDVSSEESDGDSDEEEGDNSAGEFI